MKIQRKISLIFRTDFIFALIYRHFIGLTRYFRLWKLMPQIKEPVSNKFNEMELKIQELIFFFKIVNFYLNFWQFKTFYFYIEFSWIFYTSLFIWYISISCEIYEQNYKMPRNGSKNKIRVEHFPL